MKERYTQDRIQTFGLLLILAVLVHVAYTFYVRPQAAGWQAREQALQAENAEYTPRRSVLVILKDPEQEVAIILGLWAFGLALLKGLSLGRQRRQLDAGLLKVPAGFRILPGDVREYTHKLEQLPAAERDLIPARTIRRSLKRFGETANVQDAATTVHDYCESEASRLDAELSLIRFCVWAIPAVGFVGTVRGIGEALAGAQTALRGDTECRDQRPRRGVQFHLRGADPQHRADVRDPRAAAAAGAAGAGYRAACGRHGDQQSAVAIAKGGGST